MTAVPNGERRPVTVREQPPSYGQLETAVTVLRTDLDAAIGLLRRLRSGPNSLSMVSYDLVQEVDAFLLEATDG